MALVRTNISEERIASIISMARIGELGTTLALVWDGLVSHTNASLLS
jgi:hypothetical protein